MAFTPLFVPWLPPLLPPFSSCCRAVFHDVRKKAVSAAASEASPAAPVEPSPPPAPEPAPTAQPGCVYRGVQDVAFSKNLPLIDYHILLGIYCSLSSPLFSSPSPFLPVSLLPPDRSDRRWRSRRVLAEQGLIPPPLDSGNNSSSNENATATEAFPALSGFPSLGPARAAGPSPVVAAGRWGQVADTSSSRTTGQKIEKEGGVTPAPAGTASEGAKIESEGPLAAPPSASNAVLSTPSSQGKEKESTFVAPTVTGATESLNVQDSSVGVRQEKVEGNVAVDVIAEGVAAVDLKSKFGTKKKKKKHIDIDA